MAPKKRRTAARSPRNEAQDIVGGTGSGASGGIQDNSRGGIADMFSGVKRGLETPMEGISGPSGMGGGGAPARRKKRKATGAKRPRR